MTEDIGGLNEKYFELFGRLNENAEIISKEMREIVSKNLLEQYRAEYSLFALRKEIEHAREAYALQIKRGALVPRSWRFLGLFRRKYNTAAELIGEEIGLEVQQDYVRQQAQIERMGRALYGEEEGDVGDEEDELPQEAPQETQEPQDGTEDGKRQEMPQQGAESADGAEDVV